MDFYLVCLNSDRYNDMLKAVVMAAFWEIPNAARYVILNLL